MQAKTLSKNLRITSATLEISFNFNFDVNLKPFAVVTLRQCFGINNKNIRKK